MKNPSIKDILNVAAGEIFSMGGVDWQINVIQFMICALTAHPLLPTAGLFS